MKRSDLVLNHIDIYEKRDTRVPVHHLWDFFFDILNACIAGKENEKVFEDGLVALGVLINFAERSYSFKAMLESFLDSSTETTEQLYFAHQKWNNYGFEDKRIYASFTQIHRMATLLARELKTIS